MLTEICKRKPRYIVEVGFGDAKKIGDLASRHPDRQFFGYEVPSNIGKVESFLPNLSLKYEGAFEGLSKLPRESVSIGIIDLALEGDFIVTKWQWFLPGAKIDEVRQSDLCGRAQFSTQEIFDTWRMFCLKTMYWALEKRGRLYISTFKGDLKKIFKSLDETGFTYDEYREATDEEVAKSTYMKGITEKRKTGDENFGDEAIIIRILARKKQVDENDQNINNLLKTS